jgi:hypothetical protein
VGDTYHTKEDAKPRQAKMITTIDDILQVVREMPSQKTQQRSRS